MSLLYQNNFQSYAAGTNPPYGDLVTYSGVIADEVVADSAGLFGQTKSLSLAPTEFLSYPTVPFSGGPWYQQCTVYQSLKINQYQDEQGTLVQWRNAYGAISDQALSGIRILTDGTIAIVAEFTSSFSPNSAVSDFSFLCEKWYLVRTDISFGTTVSGKLSVISCKVWVNGVVVVQIGLTATTISLTPFDSPYWNFMIFGGGGVGYKTGGISIYDAIPVDTFYPNPGTPKARINQGVIELIRRRTLPATSGNTRIYEA